VSTALCCILTIYKGKNSELDQFLREKNDSLQQFAERIESILRKGNLTKAELEKANDELDLLRYYKKKYIGQIDSLNSVIISLGEENNNLKTDIKKQKSKNEILNMDVARLSNKVVAGSRLTTQNVYVTGIKQRTNGKEKETIRVSQLSQLKITFLLNENYVTDKGQKEIYLKIIGPDGSTVYNQIAGSGTFNFQNEESLYSTKKTIECIIKPNTVHSTYTLACKFIILNNHQIINRILIPYRVAIEQKGKKENNPLMRCFIGPEIGKKTS
jgi:hypothetical protein